MKAALVTALGRTPTYGDAAEPVATDDLVVADVRAAALKNIELELVAGSHYGSGQLQVPGLVGLDAVVTLPDGRRVYTGATPPGGAMAERMLVDPETTIDVPATIGDATAAAMPNAAVSAWFALEYAGQLRQGQSVLVLGATGVTGSVALQLAKHRFGANRVVVAGRDTERLERLTALGADATVPLDASGRAEAELRSLHAAHPFDLVLDYLWGNPAEQTLRGLANNDLTAEFHRTRYVQIGAMAAGTIELPADTLRSAGIELLGQGAGSVPRAAFGRIVPEVLPALFAMLDDGAITVDTRVRPLSEVREAWTARLPSGVRMVLTPQPQQTSAG